MEHKIYVHIGSNNYDTSLFRDIKNIENFVKPMGGLWGSPINSSYGWENWVKDNNFNNTLGFDKYGNDRFYFKLCDSARLLYINNVHILKSLPQVEDNIFEIAKPFTILDFEQLKENYDAIEVDISADNTLYWELYGWDVDSILVLNPNVVEVVEIDR